MTDFNKEYWKKRAGLAESELVELYRSFRCAIEGSSEIFNINELEAKQTERRSFISSPDAIKLYSEDNFKELFKEALLKEHMWYNYVITEDGTNEISFWFLGSDYKQDGWIIEATDHDEVFKQAYLTISNPKFKNEINED